MGYVMLGGQMLLPARERARKHLERQQTILERIERRGHTTQADVAEFETVDALLEMDLAELGGDGEDDGQGFERTHSPTPNFVRWRIVLRNLYSAALRNRRDAEAMRKLVAALALGVVLAFLAGTPAHAQGGPCYGLDQASQAYADLEGEWFGHTRKMTIYTPGCGYMDWRTYMPCPEGADYLGIACEPAANGTREVAGHTRFIFEGRPDAQTILGRFTPVYVNEATWLQGIFTLRMIEPGVLQIDRPASILFCNQEAVKRLRCGA